MTIDTDEFTLQTFSQNPDPENLVKHLRKKYPGGKYIAGYEAGYFGYDIQRKLEALGVECMVIHPSDIPTTHKEKDQKRDPRDSRKIARAIRNKEVTPIWIPPVETEQDRQLLRTREALSRDQTRMKNRIKSFLQIHGIKYPVIFNNSGSHWSRRFMRWLEGIELEELSGTESLRCMVRHLYYLRGELLMVNKHIRTLSKSDVYHKKCLKLIKLRGIGIITAMSILTEVGNVHRFRKADNFRSFIGFIPRSNSSGDKDYQGKITKRANTHLRKLLIEATWSAIKYDPYYLQLYRNYRKRMNQNKALIRTGGNLINQIYCCLKNESEE